MQEPPSRYRFDGIIEFCYERPYQMPLSLYRLEDGVLVGTKAIQEMEEQLQMIRKKGWKKRKIDKWVLSMGIM
jgi:hypothetical protein